MLILTVFKCVDQFLVKQISIILNCQTNHIFMKTRAQRKIEEETQAVKTRANNNKKTKKELLEEKNQQNQKPTTGKEGGKKKVKEDPVPAPQTRRSKRSQTRVTNEKSSEKKQKDTNKTSTDAKQEEKRKSLSANKKDDNEERSRKKPSESKKQSAKEQQESKAKNSAKDNLKEQKESAKQVIKSIQFKGKVPIDEYCDLKNSNNHVLEHNGKVYSATLNQTNVSHNNNKFYMLQIIQQDSNKTCYFYTRWGRVGVKGQHSKVGPLSIEAAIREYEKKYREKAHNGDYMEIELNFQADDKGDEKSESKAPNKADQQKDFDQSKLPQTVKRLIELIFDLNMMNNQMKQIGYNVKKMPLGNLKREHIMKGYNVLKELMDELRGKNDKQTIQRLTSKFYTIIPHDFGFSQMSNFILSNEKLVKEKIEMLETLAEIKIATELIDDSMDANNKLDSNYQKLNRDIQPIPKDTSEFQIINKYLQSTHASTHTSYELELVDLFSLKSQVEDLRYTKDIGNKMLLWHGSRLTNFVGILSQGLRIAPPEAPVTGYMFGKGVYFADMSSKSANYCFTSRDNNTGILLLCQVALGEMNEKFNADYYASNLPAGKHSTKGVGRTTPNPVNAVKMDDGVVIPMGPGEPANVACTLLYNEFIVYDIAQIKIRYLLRTKFNYRGY